MNISLHLVFNGDCRAAFEWYCKLLGGDLTILSFGDSPLAEQTPPQWHDKIVHATLLVNDRTLADGGDIQLPIQETFWLPAFGVVVDRFGTPWEINGQHRA